MQANTRESSRSGSADSCSVSGLLNKGGDEMLNLEAEIALLKAEVTKRSMEILDLGDTNRALSNEILRLRGALDMERSINMKLYASPFTMTKAEGLSTRNLAEIEMVDAVSRLTTAVSGSK